MHLFQNVLKFLGTLENLRLRYFCGALYMQPCPLTVSTMHIRIIAMPIDYAHHAYACAFCSCTRQASYVRVAKGCQQHMSKLHNVDARHAGYVLYRALVLVMTDSLCNRQTNHFTPWPCVQGKECVDAQYCCKAIIEFITETLVSKANHKNSRI